MNLTKELRDTLEGLEKAKLTEDGKELLNPVPLNVNINEEKPLTLKEQIARVTRADVINQLKHDAQTIETFEESEDFDIEDSFDTQDPLSGYEVQEMEEEFLPDPELEAALAAEEEVPMEEAPETAPKDAGETPPAA